MKAPRLRCALLLFVVLAGCGRDNRYTPPEPARNPPNTAAESAIADLLRAHGEKRVVTGADGVGIEGSATRIHASLYSSKKEGAAYLVETEFRTRLGTGEEIVDYIAVTLDNGDQDELTEMVKKLRWPARENAYIAKEFIVIN